MIQRMVRYARGHLQFTSPGQLKDLGVLGMNARNHEYVQSGNPPELIREVDDKLATKLLCRQFGIESPKLVGVVRYQHELRDVDRRSSEFSLGEAKSQDDF